MKCPTCGNVDKHYIDRFGRVKCSCCKYVIKRRNGWHTSYSQHRTRFEDAIRKIEVKYGTKER